jgi:serine/threonine protein kinase
LIRGLKYVHSANVIHRDLKPANILLNANCDLKICDFGLARINNNRGFMTEYVTTRWYRAPELLLSQESYTSAIDMWSVGCIFAELIGRRPLFNGKNAIDQVTMIIEHVGSLDSNELAKVQSERARDYIRTLPFFRGVPLFDLYPEANPLALDLIHRLLAFDPAKRMSAQVSRHSSHVS